MISPKTLIEITPRIHSEQPENKRKLTCALKLIKKEP
jgi:hypothetical protein